jgi:hypothetical protein
MVRPKYLTCLTCHDLFLTVPIIFGILDFPRKIAIHSRSGFEGIDEKPGSLRDKNGFSCRTNRKKPIFLKKFTLRSKPRQSAWVKLLAVICSPQGHLGTPLDANDSLSIRRSIANLQKTRTHPQNDA